ncbi:hypothetical protein [Rubrivirga sp.]|uniref:hypothetical protein n=1 Tax=Rubrivirga sp. TaxID=1885344 RepID=UPI003C76AC23
MSSPSDLPPFRPLPDHVDQETDALGAPISPEDDTSPEAAEGRRSLREASRVPLAILGGLVAAGIFVFAIRGDEIQAASPTTPAPAEAEAAPIVPLNPDDPYTFAGLDIHPDRLYGQYFAGAFSGRAPAADAEGFLSDFLWRLEMYRNAYGVDDNFTIRVLDDRTGETLEIQQIRSARDAFNGSGQADWDAVNRQRRTVTSGLRQKWQDYGIPRENIVIRWGYKDQTLEARARDQRYITYEVNLARRLGLSVLATEIGTVETFNQDKLISSAGARSRYQMMPDILRMFDVEQYSIPVASGGSIEVKEEHHPLLSVEPYLMLVRAYANAVGHELPGISAYHTGPGNIFKLYREYLRANPGLARDDKHVSDAYMWGVTDGFEQVDAVSSFGPHSRAYVLKAYGSLRATEDERIDPGQTINAERVQLRPGASATLSQILTALEPHGRRLDWGPIEGATLYEKFRDLNPQIALPASNGDVPASGNLRLTATAGDIPIRFFLPAGASAVLERVGLDVIGVNEPFNERTFLLDESERTQTDRDYERLVSETGDFGFTRSAQRRMDRIHDQLQTLASQNPDSRYRQTQAKVARIHRSIWRTASFRSLVATTETLLSVDPRVNIGRQPITDASADAPSRTAPARQRDTIDALEPKPPTIEDTIQY